MSPYNYNDEFFVFGYELKSSEADYRNIDIPSKYYSIESDSYVIRVRYKIPYTEATLISIKKYNEPEFFRIDDINLVQDDLIIKAVSRHEDKYYTNDIIEIIDCKDGVLLDYKINTIPKQYNFVAASSLYIEELAQYAASTIGVYDPDKFLYNKPKTKPVPKKIKNINKAVKAEAKMTEEEIKRKKEDNDRRAFIL